jgi:hypothetical protein
MAIADRDELDAPFRVQLNKTFEMDESHTPDTERAEAQSSIAHAAWLYITTFFEGLRPLRTPHTRSRGALKCQVR